MNKFIGIGRNTKNGELRNTESGISVYSNSIATILPLVAYLFKNSAVFLYAI